MILTIGLENLDFFDTFKIILPRTALSLKYQKNEQNRIRIPRNAKLKRVNFTR